MRKYKLHSVCVRSSDQTAASAKRRADERLSVYTIAARITAEGLSAPLPCTVRDISKSGARLELDREGIRRPLPNLRLPKRLTVYFCPSKTEVRCRLSWQDGRHFGVEFSSGFIAEIFSS